MKNFRKVHYGFLITAFCCSLIVFAIGLIQKKFDGSHLTMAFWIAYVFALEKQSDRNSDQISELRSQIDKMIEDVKKINSN